jgi:hypothetical protein
MYEMPEPPHIDLPEGWTPPEPKEDSFEDWFDAKCTEAHEYNKANGYTK